MKSKRSEKKKQSKAVIRSLSPCILEGQGYKDYVNELNFSFIKFALSSNKPVLKPLASSNYETKPLAPTIKLETGISPPVVVKPKGLEVEML